MSTLTVQNIQGSSSSSNTISIASGHKITGAAGSIVPTGGIIQVVQGIYESQASSTSSSYVDTGLSVTITPKFSTSKVLVTVDMMFSHAPGYSGSNVRLVRDSTVIYYGAGTGHQSINSGLITSSDWPCYRLSAVYLDSPATASATVYKVQYQGQQSQYVGINRTQRVNATYDTAGASTITVMEVAQ
jgi:hypothetical protein